VAIVIDTTNKSTSGAQSSVSSFSWSHTVVSNPQQVLFLVLSWLSLGGTGFPTTTTRGSQSFLPTGGAQYANMGSGRHLWCQILYILNPTVGTATISIPFNQAGIFGWGGAVAMAGVNQVTPTDTPIVSFGGPNKLATITAPSVPPDLVLDVVSVDQGPNATVGPGQTTLWNAMSGGEIRGHASYEYSAGTTVTASYTLSSNRFWINFAANILTSLIVEKAVTDSLSLGTTDVGVATIQVFASGDTVAVQAVDLGVQSLTPIEGLPIHLLESAVVVSSDFVGIKLGILDSASMAVVNTATPIAAVDEAALGATETATVAYSILTDDTVELPVEAVLSNTATTTASDTLPVPTTDVGRAASPLMTTDSLRISGTESAPSINTDFIQAVQAQVTDTLRLSVSDSLLVTAVASATDSATVAIASEVVDIFGFVPDYFLEISASDTCVVRVLTFPGIPPISVGPFADSLRLGALEAPDSMREHGVLDTIRYVATDATAAIPIPQLVFTVTDTQRIVATDVGAAITQPFVQLSVTDSLKVQESALLTLGVLGAGSGGAESVTLSFTEARPNIIDLTQKFVVDSCRWVLTEPEHVMQNPVGRDTPAYRASEVLQPLFILGTINKPVTEGCSVLLDEGLLLTRSVAVTDNSAVAVTEVTSLFFDTVLKAATDSCRIAGTEGAPSVPGFFAVRDSLKVVGTEVVQLPIIVLASARDNVLLRHVDHTDSLLTVVVTVSRADSASLALSEAALINAPLVVTDSCRIAETDTATLDVVYADVVKTASDSLKIQGSDTATVFSTVAFLTTTDSLKVVAAEGSSVGILLLFTVADSLRWAVTENTPNTIAVFFDFEFLYVTDSHRLVATDTAVRVIDLEYMDKAVTDSLRIVAEDTASIFRIYQEFTVTDGARIAATEDATVLRVSLALDSAAVAASEVVTLFRDAMLTESLKWVVSEALLAAFITDQAEDAIEVLSSETAALTAQEQAVTDTLTVALDAAPSIAVVLTVTDSAKLGQADVALATLEVLTADSAAVQVAETTDLQQQWNLTDSAAVVADESLANDFIAWEVADDVLVQLDAVLNALTVDTQAEDQARWFIDSEHLNQHTAGVVFITTLTEDSGAIQAEETFAGPSEYGVTVDDECAIVIGEELADYELGRLPDLFIYVPDAEQEDLQAFPFSYDAQESNVW
jgi:hypothetical protein